MAARLLTVFLTLLTLSSAAPRKGHFLGVPVSNPEIPASDVITDRYIVVYNSTFSSEAINTHQSKWIAKIAKANVGKRSLDGRPLSTKASTFKLGAWQAMALEADDRMMNQMFEADEVSYIEADSRVSVKALSSQDQATSGLARISHADAGESSYVFDSTAGEGITAFVVDTGIRVTHSEFQGRATFAANFVNDVVSCLPPNPLVWSTHDMN